jgi:hypothetical protein
MANCHSCLAGFRLQHQKQIMGIHNRLRLAGQRAVEDRFLDGFELPGLKPGFGVRKYQRRSQ